MSVPTPESSTVKSIIETLLKPVTMVLNPIAERIGNWLKRKPRLHIYVRPQLSAWCYAWDGSTKLMQARFTADITNDGDEGILILDGYLKGTKPQIPFVNRIEVPPTTTVTGEQIAVFVRPVIGEDRKDFTGKVILLDQFKRKHPTDKIAFTWVGPTEPPKPPTPSSS